MYWRLLVAFLADPEADNQEAIPFERVYNLQATARVLADTQPKCTTRREPKLLPGERRRLQKERGATEEKAREEARATAEALAVAEANAVLER